jgi:hypothetical protein
VESGPKTPIVGNEDAPEDVAHLPFGIALATLSRFLSKSATIF